MSARSKAETGGSTSSSSARSSPRSGRASATSYPDSRPRSRSGPDFRPAVLRDLDPTNGVSREELAAPVVVFPEGVARRREEDGLEHEHAEVDPPHGPAAETRPVADVGGGRRDQHVRV